MKKTIFTLLTALTPFSAHTFENTCYQETNYCNSFNSYCKWYIHTDYLYLNACRAGLDYAIETDKNETTLIVGPGEINQLHRKSNSGARIQVGYCFDCNADINLKYTFFQTEHSHRTHFCEGAGATRIHPGDSLMGPNHVKLADPQYQLKYNVVDGEMGSWFSHNGFLNVRPYIAFRYASINQDMKTLYQDEISIETHIKQSVDLQGYGIMAGADGRFNVCDCVFLVARAAGGALYGDFNYKTFIEDNRNETLMTRVDTYGSDCRTVLSTEVSLGLELDLCSICGKNLILALGYELHTWLGLADFPDFTGSQLSNKVMRDNNTLLLQGLFVRLGASF
jgi:Legionella pneumophila major outer membrane protein precursor